ncbi:MAG TPA: type VI secretion system accessory protein TagJ, partial [Longimicrobium sp.]|nr:type VI secretion system accessory protein TagJ [Longimicrobium sp.]
QPSSAYQGGELGEVLLPVLAPLSWRHPDGEVRLGRVTDWEEGEDGGEPVPVGQKLLLVDGEPVPILEVRALEIARPAEGP